MQFIPSTWSVVGVDGDNDGARNPQDIDDAALATAVYLCSGDDDLSAEQGQRASVYRYNHSNDYVDLVLSIMQAYMDGDFTAVPTATTSSASSPPPRPVRPGVDQGPRPDPGPGQARHPVSSPAPRPPRRRSSRPPADQEPTPAPTPTPTQQPTQQPT